MQSIDNYLQIMIESLTKKSELLEKLIQKNEEQQACVKDKEFEEIEAHQFDYCSIENKERIWGIFGEEDNRKEPEFDDYSTIDAMSGLFSTCPYNYNGWETKSIDIPFLGEGDK